MAGLIEALSSRVEDHLPLGEAIASLSRARLLIEMGWSSWAHGDNWRKEAIGILKSTNRVYTLSDPNVPSGARAVPTIPLELAIYVLETISMYEDNLSVLLSELGNIENIDLFRAGELSSMYHSARDELIFATVPMFSFIQAMAIPVPLNQMSTIVGEA
ncbi:MAG: hypothetical protein E4G89_04275 [Methanothrix sp.]|nr:MAG: hypothetical protein E4G89_04275 [Methanothrix sp.]